MDALLDFMGNAVKPETRAETCTIPVDESPAYILLEPQHLQALRAALRSAKRAHEAGISAHVTLGAHAGVSSAVVKIRNATPAPAAGQIRVAKIPRGLRLKQPLLAYGPQPSNTTRSYYLPIASIAQPCEGRVAGVVRRHDELYEFERHIAVLCSSRPPGQMHMDGRTNDWNVNQPHITLDRADQIVSGDAKRWKGPDDLSADIWSCWDASRLYLLVKVRDNRVSQRPDRPYLGDCVELFLDLDPVGDVEHNLYNEDDCQLFFTPPDRSGRPAALSPVSVNAGRFADTRYACTVTHDGYVMEIAFSAEALTRSALSAGAAIGFDIAVDDKDDEDPRKVQMIWHGDDNAFKFTDRFGFLVLAGRAF